MQGFRRWTARLLITSTVAASLVTGGAGLASAQEDMIHLSDCGLLLEGQTSTCVALLQSGLNETGAPYNLATDGVFGAGTRIALLDFQGRNRLSADGNAGPEVFGTLIGQVGDLNVLDLDGRTPWPTANAVDPESINPNTGLPYEPCQEGTIRHNGECYGAEFLDGEDLWGGRTVAECADDATLRAVRSIIDAENARAAGREVGRQIGKKLLTVPTIFKCVLWD